MQIIITPSGDIRCIYAETLDLTTIGNPTITRASYVEPDERGQWYADLSPVSGPRLGPFAHRSEALTAEQTWLVSNWLESGQ